MIPSRGLRWSGQSFGVGRRRLEPLYKRSLSSFSSSSSPSRSISAFSNATALNSRTVNRPQIQRASLILQNGTPQRYQSTSTSISDSTSATLAGASTELVPNTSFSSLDNAIDLSTTSLDQIPVHIGYLKSLGLDYGWGPTAIMEWTLEHIHVLSGTPWWASIILTAITLRLALFYPYIGAADNAAKLATVNPLTKPLYEKMRAASSMGDTAETIKLRGELKMIQKRAGVSILKSLIPLVQAPLGYGTFVLLRGMAKLPVPGLDTGGVLWFPNLTLPDPLFLLPIATAGVLHWVLRKGGETGVNTLSPGTVKALSYGLPALTVIFTWWLPAGLQLSFLVSGIFSAFQSRLFRWKTFRELFNMTPMPKKNDPFSKAPTPSPYQPRIITAQSVTNSTGSYQAPRRSSAPSHRLSGFPTPPVEKKPTLLSGLTKEVKSSITAVQESAKQTMKSAREYTGQDRKNGKRTKQEIRQAEQYEKKRRDEDARRLEELDTERRARREGRRREREARQ